MYYAAQKDKEDFKYKNLDDLAVDMGFVKVEGEYKRVEDDLLIDLDYIPHDPIRDLNLNF